MPEKVKTWEQAVRWCMHQPEMAGLADAAYFFDDPLEAGRRYHASAEFAALRKLLPATPGRALDIGAGNGILSYALSIEGWRVTALEPDRSDLVGAGAIRAMAGRAAQPIEVIESFGEEMPVPAASYDLVMARQVLHHARDLPALAREMARVARDGASIVTLRDHVISGLHQLQPFLRNHPLHDLYGGENAFTLLDYRRALEDAKLLIEREFLSFQSPMNFDPMTETDVRRKLAAAFGPLKGVVRAATSMLPFGLVAGVASRLDRRPGRLVSFVCQKTSGSL